MLYLIGSVLFLAMNNVLWAHYAPLHNSLRLISKRAVYTSVYLALILSILVFTGRISIDNNLQRLLAPAILGFIGLFSLVNGFRTGSITQFSVYSLLLVFILGLKSSTADSSSPLDHPWSLIVVAMGYLYFIWKQFRNPKDQINYQSHIYFALAHLCFGLVLHLQWKLLEETNQFTLAFFQELMVLIAATLLGSIHSSPVTPKRVSAIKEWEYALMAMPICMAVIFGLEGLKSTNPFHSTLIGLLTPAATLMIGVMLKKDVVNKSAIAGLVLMLIGLFWFYY